MLAQATRVPQPPPIHKPVAFPVVLLGLGDHDLGLLHEARHVRVARASAARAKSAHERLPRALDDTLRADVAGLPFRFLRARLRRAVHSLTVPIVGMVLLVAPAPLDPLTPVSVVRFPVQLLAVAPAVALLAGAAAGRIVLEGGCTIGAGGEDDH